MRSIVTLKPLLADFKVCNVMPALKIPVVITVLKRFEEFQSKGLPDCHQVTEPL
jgi:hypothetical protein